MKVQTHCEENKGTDKLRRKDRDTERKMKILESTQRGQGSGQVNKSTETLRGK